jgi:hypothetical protein
MERLQRDDPKGLAATVRAFHDSTASIAPVTDSSVDLNEVVTTIGHHHPEATTVQLASTPMPCRGSRADAMALADALLAYLRERATGKVSLSAVIDDELPRLRLQASATLPPVERLRLLRPGAPLEEVRATVRARLALARSAALRSGVQLSSRVDGERVVVDVIFEPSAAADGGRS